MSLPMTADEAGASLQLQRPRKTIEEDRSYFESLGIGESVLTNFVRYASVFTATSLQSLYYGMNTVGWDTSKYLYGPLKTRVVW